MRLQVTTEGRAREGRVKGLKAVIECDRSSKDIIRHRQIMNVYSECGEGPTLF